MPQSGPENFVDLKKQNIDEIVFHKSFLQNPILTTCANDEKMKKMKKKNEEMQMKKKISYKSTSHGYREKLDEAFAKNETLIKLCICQKT